MIASRLVCRGVRDLVLERVELAPPGPGEVLVRTRLSAVSVSSELGVVEGRVPITFPATLGYQTLGTAEGARVMTTLGHAGAGVVRADRCLEVPPHVPDRVALAAILGEETHKGIRKVAPLPHERVLVAGAGLLGLLTIFNLTRRGVERVSVLEPDPHRRALARAFGALPCPAGESGPGFADFDVGFECSASPDGFADLLGRLRPGGRACVLSDGNWGGLALPRAFHERELSVVASSDGDDYPAYARWLWQNPDAALASLFQETITPLDLPSAFSRLRTFPRPVSLVVDWAHFDLI